jgi:hypothetical protein
MPVNGLRPGDGRQGYIFVHLQEELLVVVTHVLQSAAGFVLLSYRATVPHALVLRPMSIGR